jgi:tungstate transport system ATP-binding protein
MIEEILQNEAAGGTKVILVTHDIAQARRLADEVIFLVGGRLVEKCAANDFFNAPQSEAARDYLAGRLIIAGINDDQQGRKNET